MCERKVHPLRQWEWKKSPDRVPSSWVSCPAEGSSSASLLTARILLLGAQNPLKTEQLKCLEMMRTQGRGACALNTAPGPARAPGLHAVRLRLVKRLQICSYFRQKHTEAEWKARLLERTPWGLGRIRKFLVKKPFEILCLSQKRKFLFGDQSMCHRYLARCHFWWPTALLTSGGAYKPKTRVHTPAAHKQMDCWEPHHPGGKSIQIQTQLS